MAVTVTEVSLNSPLMRAWTVIASADADTDAVITPSGVSLNATTRVAVILVPLTAAARISSWVLSSALPSVAAGFTVTKVTTASSGDAAAQLLVLMFAPPLAELTHP